MTFGFGVAAALTGPLVMTLGFIAWDNHWKGSAFALNLYKCNLASIGFLILACTTRSHPFPSHVFTIQAMGYMVLSSTIGIIVGDWTWLEALQMLGARRVILMDSLKPFLAALLGWLILDEQLRPAAFGGIFLTVAGVLIVSLETTPAMEENEGDNNGDEEGINEQRDQAEIQQHAPNHEDPNSDNLRSPENEKADSAAELSVVEESGIPQETIVEVSHYIQKTSSRDLRRGYPYAILNVVLDTYGAVLIKQHGKDFKVWEINLLRFGFAGTGFLGNGCFHRKFDSCFQSHP